MAIKVLAQLSVTVFLVVGLVLALGSIQAEAFTQLSPDRITCTPCHTDGRTGAGKTEPAKQPVPAAVPAQAPAPAKATTAPKAGGQVAPVPNKVVGLPSIFKGPTAVVSINGVMRKTEILMEKGVTYIPARSLSEFFVAYPEWDNKQKAVIFRSGGNSLTVFTNKKIAAVNGRQVQMKAGAKLVKNRAFLPVRALAEALGGAVEHDSYATYVMMPALAVKQQKIF